MNLGLTISARRAVIAMSIKQFSGNTCAAAKPRQSL
jgi:hypothetical protein